MLTVSQLSKSFAGQALFDNVSLQVNRGDRIGLVGPNGAGAVTRSRAMLGSVPEKPRSHGQGFPTRKPRLSQSTALQTVFQSGARGTGFLLLSTCPADGPSSTREDDGRNDHGERDENPRLADPQLHPSALARWIERRLDYGVPS